MLQTVSILTVYFIEMLISYLFFLRTSGSKRSLSVCIVIGTLLFEAAAGLNFVFENTIWLNALSFFLINLIFSLLCFDIKPIKAVFYSILLDIFSTALEFVTIFAISAMFNVNITDYNSEITLLIIEGAICKVLYFITCMILSGIIKPDKSTPKYPLGFYVYPGSTIAALLVFWYVCSQKEITKQGQTLMAAISFLLFGATVILFITYQQSIKKENNYLLLQKENDRLRMEKNYYDILEHQNNKLMIYAHDAKNHLAAIKGLNTDPKIDEYIDKMSENLRSYTNRCHSGNMTLDVIINRYYTECELNGIKLLTDVRVNNLSFVDDFDLVTIIGNLMDNAVFAAEKSMQKNISLETDVRNSYGVIIVSNSSDTAPQSKNGRLITTHKEKKAHDIGLKSVSQTLKKYDGDFAWEYDEANRTFTTTIMLKLNAKAK